MVRVMTKPPTTEARETKPAEPKVVIVPAWWPGVKQQAEAELERVLKDAGLTAEPVAYEHPGTLLIHVWDRVRGNARARYVVQPYFEGGGEPGLFPSAFRGWLRAAFVGEPPKVKPAAEFDHQPPPGPPPLIPVYVAIRLPHGWQLRTYDLTPEALAVIAAYETGRSGEMPRGDLCDLIANDIQRLDNQALKVSV